MPAAEQSAVSQWEPLKIHDGLTCKNTFFDILGSGDLEEMHQGLGPAKCPLPAEGWWSAPSPGRSAALRSICGLGRRVGAGAGAGGGGCGGGGQVQSGGAALAAALAAPAAAHVAVPAAPGLAPATAAVLRAPPGAPPGIEPTPDWFPALWQPHLLATVPEARLGGHFGQLLAAAAANDHEPGFTPPGAGRAPVADDPGACTLQPAPGRGLEADFARVLVAGPVPKPHGVSGQPVALSMPPHCATHRLHWALPHVGSQHSGTPELVELARELGLQSGHMATAAPSKTRRRRGAKESKDPDRVADVASDWLPTATYIDLGGLARVPP